MKKNAKVEWVTIRVPRKIAESLSSMIKVIEQTTQKLDTEADKKPELIQSATPFADKFLENLFSKHQEKRDTRTKTIKELHSEGLLSTYVRNFLRRRGLDDDTTIEELFNQYSEEEMMRWRGMGPKYMQELKGLL